MAASSVQTLFESFCIFMCNVRESLNIFRSVDVSVLGICSWPMFIQVPFLHLSEFQRLRRVKPGAAYEPRRGLCEREAESSVTSPRVAFLMARAERKESYLFASQYVFPLLPLQVTQAAMGGTTQWFCPRCRWTASFTRIIIIKACNGTEIDVIKSDRGERA